MTTKIKATIEHGLYGCDTGCCGHRIKVGDHATFDFYHPYGEDSKVWAERQAKKFAAENGIDPESIEMDWLNSVVCDD